MVSFKLFSHLAHHCIMHMEHIHMVETSPTLLVEVNLPLKFWDHVFQALTYLINIVLIVTLAMSSPYLALYNIVQNYKFLKIFSSSYYPHEAKQSLQICLSLGGVSVLGHAFNHKGYNY